jgi:hypothetical protein
MGTFQFSIQGASELREALNALPKAIADKIVDDAAKKGAAVVAAQVKAEAPRNKAPRRKKFATLALHLAVRVGDKKTVSRRGKGKEVRASKGQGVAYVGFAKNSDGRIAHIIEFGRQAGTSKKGRNYSAAPANGFMRRALSQSSSQAIATATRYASKQVIIRASELGRKFSTISKSAKRLLSK